MNQPEEQYIEATVFCEYHQVEHSFIFSLEESGLIELILIDEQKFIPKEQLPQVEKLVRLHQDLEINLSGVEVVVHLLQRMEEMQQKIKDLENRLRFHEE